ncbi:MAG: replication factor C large subunit [Candidatus Aenigmatarchaeota archaeon]
MLVEKYKPRSLREVLGQKEIILKIDEWLKKGYKKALLIYGPSGTGKTLIPSLVAKERNMNLFEINASDERSAPSLKERLLPASKESSLFKKRLILIDDVDSFSQTDRGGIAEIINIIKESNNPIILTANDAYNEKLKNLRNYCELLRIKKIPKNLIEKKLLEIATKEKIKISKEDIEKIAENADGDIRSAINDLEANSYATRDKEKNIFEVLNNIFRSKNLEKALKAIDSSDKDLDEIFWWVEQNIPLEYNDPKLIAMAFDILSKADLFKSQIIKNQNYRFNKYLKNMIASIALLENPQKKFILYKPPERLITLGSTKGFRKEKEIFYKSLNLKCSLRKIKEQIPFLKIILKEFKDF